MVVVYHHDSAHTNSFFVAVFVVHKFEVLTGHDISTLHNDMLLAVYDLGSLDVLEVAIAGLIITSLLNTALNEATVVTSSLNEVDLFGKTLVGREFASINGEEVVLFVLDKEFTLKPGTYWTLEGMVDCCFGHDHFIFKAIMQVVY